MSSPPVSRQIQQMGVSCKEGRRGEGGWGEREGSGWGQMRVMYRSRVIGSDM